MNELIREKIQTAKTEESLYFNLYDVEITDEIFHAISDLSHLEKLEFVSCTFTDIPESISNLVNLKALRLMENDLEKFPAVITKLTKLEQLSLSFNKLETLPEELEKLKELVYLDISYNLFDTIPSIISKLEKLKILDASLIPIKDFSIFKKLGSLESLFLNSCDNISQSLIEISYLKNLKNLQLHKNKFTEFPTQLLNLVNLETLLLSGNEISSIPNEINRLQNLKEINLQGNKLLQFPIQLLDLPKLEKPMVLGNPFTSNALKFQYTLPTPKKKFSSINLNNLKFTRIYQREFIYLEDNNNIVLFFSLPLDLKRTDSFSFLIQVLGKDETKKTILRQIRNRVDLWIKEEDLKFSYQNERDEEKEFVSRFFFYPNENKKDFRESRIHFDQLLRLGAAKENIYFDEIYRRKIPVKDLLDYIGVDDIELNGEKTKKEWKGKSFITEIRIDNFKIFNNLQFTLSEHFNIVLGRNGLGKTSILQAVTLGLLPLENIDKSNNFEDYINMLQNDTNSEVSLSWGEEYRRVYIFKNELNEEEYVNFPQKLILAYGVNLNTNPELDHSDIVNKILFGDALPYSTKSIFSDYSTNFHDPLIILEKLIIERDGKNSKTVDSLIHLIGNTLNNYLNLIEDIGGIYLEGKNIDFDLNGKIKLRTTRVKTARKRALTRVVSLIKDTNFYFTDINGNQLKTRNLSEGYRDHILLVTDILIRIIASRNEIFGKENIEITPQFFKEVNGVILIDEFDRHLHPVWQRKLLSRFKEDFPKIQFILTTHNPFSVQSAVGANAIELIVEDKTIKTVNKTIESRNILSIIREYFTKDFFDYETQEQMKHFSKYLDEIDEGNIDLAYSQEFKNIVESISEKSDELKSIIGSQLLQLNATLKKINRKEFEL